MLAFQCEKQMQKFCVFITFRIYRYFSFRTVNACINFEIFHVDSMRVRLEDNRKAVTNFRCIQAFYLYFGGAPDTQTLQAVWECTPDPYLTLADFTWINTPLHAPENTVEHPMTMVWLWYSSALGKYSL